MQPLSPGQGGVVPDTGRTRRKILALDLDETLVHATCYPDPSYPSSSADVLTLEVMINSRLTLYHVYKRPHVDQFLREVGWFIAGQAPPRESMPLGDQSGAYRLPSLPFRPWNPPGPSHRPANGTTSSCLPPLWRSMRARCLTGCSGPTPSSTTSSGSRSSSSRREGGTGNMHWPPTPLHHPPPSFHSARAPFLPPWPPSSCRPPNPTPSPPPRRGGATPPPCTPHPSEK